MTSSYVPLQMSWDLYGEWGDQQALYRNVSEKNAQLEKRLENVIREDFERDLEAERRKTATLQDSVKESEKEYHKLKAQYDRLKRKALLGGGDSKEGNQSFNIQERQNDPGARMKQGMAFGAGIGGAGGLDVGAVVGNMEATGVQRTPIVNRTMAGGMPPGGGATWRQPQAPVARHAAQRQPFSAMDMRSFRTSASTARSEHSDSTAEVEGLVSQTGGRPRHGGRSNDQGQWPQQQRGVTAQTQSVRENVKRRTNVKEGGGTAAQRRRKLHACMRYERTKIWIRKNKKATREETRAPLAVGG
ncbi:hypothetical protein TRAPUB_1811 [Trametes pubescens]|uniref:Uncharacterized protein n=1 Tax=Trametes pubescens TaxID=154538 RepID=A0A1M2VID7_TRAPU|nr:hypothetical protein TRAPUB_1811 [Trametes pubescens]